MFLADVARTISSLTRRRRRRESEGGIFCWFDLISFIRNVCYSIETGGVAQISFFDFMV